MNLLRTLIVATLVLYTIGMIPDDVGAVEHSKHPNVLLILTDDQGYGDLSITGNPYLKTPHIDAIARDGIRFERFYVNSFCAPTRAALLTGRYPLRCGVYGVTHNKETMRANEVTVAEAFQQAGYRTACIGKWHNGEQYPYTPPGQGFDEFFGFCNGHTNDYFDARLVRGTKPEATQGYITDVLTDEAIRFIESNRDAPFFCYVSYNAPHSPYQVPDPYYDRFQEKGFDARTASFYGMCENIDDNVGRILKALRDSSLDENTLIIFMTDNGGTAGVKHYNAGMRGGKTSVHEGGCRVPCFIRWPARFQEPARVKTITSHIDILPTLLELCSVPQPQGPPLDGRSLVPLMDAGSPDSDWPERLLFTHNPISETNRYPGAVRTQRYRLVRTVQGRQGGSSAVENDASAGPWKLFDMVRDPGEKHDVADQNPETVRELAAAYEAWYDEISRSGLERLPIPVGYRQENPVTLNAPQAYIRGPLHFDHGPGFAHDWLTNWVSSEAEVRFDIDVVRAGEFDVELLFACRPSDAGAELTLQTDRTETEVEIPASEAPAIHLEHRDEPSRKRYASRDWGILQIGRVHLPKGRQDLKLRVAKVTGEEALELKGLRLRYVEP